VGGTVACDRELSRFNDEDPLSLFHFPPICYQLVTSFLYEIYINLYINFLQNWKMALLCMMHLPKKKCLSSVQFSAFLAITQGPQSLLIIWDVQDAISVEHVM
jgi:hypothetical protein